MNKLMNFFNCGKVHIRSNINRCDFLIQDFNNIYNIIIPHFDKYPLKNIKQLDYIDFKIAVNLFKSNGKKSTDIIKQIISNMNSNREY
jgi:LAGLIDADG endonuclease